MSHTEKEAEGTIEIPAKKLIETPEKGLTEDPVEGPAAELTEGVTEGSLKGATEEPPEEPPEEPTKTVKQLAQQYRKTIMCGMVLLFTLFIIYLGMAYYFKNHFYFGTEINGINVSGKTLADAKAVMAAELDAYALDIKERGGKTEQIKASDVGLQYVSEKELKKIKDGQNCFKWISGCFNTEDSKNTAALKYDEKLLQERINRLSCFKPENIIEPQNPSFKYEGNSYVIIDEVIGNKVDINILYSLAADALCNIEAEIDLESMGCYIKPEYNSKSPKIIVAKDTLNSYIATEITYASGNIKRTLDGSRINEWLTVDENLNIKVNEEKVKDYVNELSYAFNTVGKTRSFPASSGETVTISGGDYGRSVNKVKETQYLLSAISKGEIITKEPVFNQTTPFQGINDFGNTYVEISLAKQHLWFYKSGSLIVQGDTVTGNVSQNHATREGVFRLKYKARNVILRGPDYAVHVDFWMPFDGGIGMHDANWRSMFGRNIYKSNGSHGCINLPYNVAKKIFNNITPDTPVICY